MSSASLQRRARSKAVVDAFEQLTALPRYRKRWITVGVCLTILLEAFDVDCDSEYNPKQFLIDLKADPRYKHHGNARPGAE